MNRIIVTLLLNETDTTGLDVEIPNNIESVYLVEELLKKVEILNGMDTKQYDIEFSLSGSGWQKIEKQYRFQDVGVYDGVYIRLVKNSQAVSAPYINPDYRNKKTNVAPKKSKQTEGNNAQAKQSSQDSYVWKVID